MNINRLTRVLLIGLALTIPATKASDVPMVRDFDSYINGALVVYTQAIQPSIKTSEQFYNYLEARWSLVRCRDKAECQNVGSSVALEFASMSHSRT